VHLTNDGTIHIGHVGDSRCYRISNDEIEQVTQDHSFVNDVRWTTPDIEPENLARLPQNIIMRALGKDESVDAEIRSERTLPGDIYLLCSDGLSGPVPSDQMLRIIQEAPSLQAACKALVNAANASGKDNVSVILVRIEKIIDSCHCPGCGYPIVAGMTFCVECGTRVGPGRNG
jgi:protein phosphatase